MRETNQFREDLLLRSKNRLSECYKRGVHLATFEKNYDYAHAMFGECVLHDPGNLQFVEAMIQNLRARTPRARKWHVAWVGNHPLKKAVQHKDWAKVIREGVDLLKNDPRDVATLRAMAEASAAQHHNEVELVYLKQALDAEPKSVEVNRHCGRSLARMGQFDQAIACWHRIEKLTGKDHEAAKMISMLAEAKLKYPGGRPPITKVKETQIEEVQAEDIPCETVLNAQHKLELGTTRDPQNIANYLELAELLLGSKQFNAAEALLTRAIRMCGNQKPLVVQLDQARVRRAKEQRIFAEERAPEQQIDGAALRIPWFQIATLLAVVILALQLIPPAGHVVWRSVDVRRWSRFGWFLFNIIILLVLIGVRFAPNCRAFMRRRRVRRKPRVATGSP